MSRSLSLGSWPSASPDLLGVGLAAGEPAGEDKTPPAGADAKKDPFTFENDRPSSYPEKREVHIKALLSPDLGA